MRTTRRGASFLALFALVASMLVPQMAAIASPSDHDFDVPPPSHPDSNRASAWTAWGSAEFEEDWSCSELPLSDDEKRDGYVLEEAAEGTVWRLLVINAGRPDNPGNSQGAGNSGNDGPANDGPRSTLFFDPEPREAPYVSDQTQDVSNAILCSVPVDDTEPEPVIAVNVIFDCWDLDLATDTYTANFRYVNDSTLDGEPISITQAQAGYSVTGAPDPLDGADLLPGTNQLQFTGRADLSDIVVTYDGGTETAGSLGAMCQLPPEEPEDPELGFEAAGVCDPDGMTYEFDFDGFDLPILFPASAVEADTQEVRLPIGGTQYDLAFRLDDESSEALREDVGPNGSVERAVIEELLGVTGLGEFEVRGIVNEDFLGIPLAGLAEDTPRFVDFPLRTLTSEWVTVTLDCEEPVLPVPAITLDKDVLLDEDEPIVLDEDGQVDVTYTYLVTNTGEEALGSLTLDDDRIDGDTVQDAFEAALLTEHGATTLQPDQSVLVSVTVTLTEDDFGAEGFDTEFDEHTNVATVTGIGEESGQQVQDEDQVTIQLTEVMPQVLAFEFGTEGTQGVCIADTPYLTYTMDVSDLGVDEVTLHIVELDEDGAVVTSPSTGSSAGDPVLDDSGEVIRGTLRESRVIPAGDGRLLWPGADVLRNDDGDPVDADGNVTDDPAEMIAVAWPGFDTTLNDAGELQSTENPDRFGWARGELAVFITINPTSQAVSVTYPPTTSDCDANPPQEPASTTEEPEVLGVSISAETVTPVAAGQLPRTGASSLVLTLAGLTALLLGALALARTTPGRKGWTRATGEGTARR
ncbi:MAG: hypothetical protein JJT89_12030 [Nitriliruptoraceae bacterium]|nr:hypothetical protein [Nitriliruptoraceae bacterium]